MQTFIGRSRELERLNTLHKKNKPQLVVIKGRRRIGKSRLINEFAKQNHKHTFWSFSGLAPKEGLDDQSQRDHFARQLATKLASAPFTFTDWSDAFTYLTTHLEAGDVVSFDEISWMGAHDPTFVPKLKAWWDEQTIAVTLIFCGSISTWIEENILKNTAFFGRVNLTLTLEPLTIKEGARLLKSAGFQGSVYDTYKLLSVLGGIPWYLEQITPGITADENLKRLCFEKDGLLVLEFERIFHDLFETRGTTYIKILQALKEGEKTQAEIRNALNFPHSGTLSKLLEHLITAGFVKKHHLWSFKTTQPLKQSLYRLCDPYLRFYLKLIEPNRTKIDQNTYEGTLISQLPGFDAHVGLQMEQLLLQNRALILEAMGIEANTIVADGPYRQSKNSMQQGCQIDYLVQTVTKNLFICEFKFKRRELGVEIIDQMKTKCSALKIPRGYAAVPLLFHSGGVSSHVETSSYFYRVIDIADFLEV